MSQPFEFVTPKKGVQKVAAFIEQAVDVALDALNILPFDRQGRFRANQRTGTSKLWAAAIGTGSQTVQLIDQTTIALDPASVTASTQLLNESFTYANGALQTVATSAVWKTYTGGGVNDTTMFTVAGNLLQSVVGASGGFAVYQPALSLGSAYIVKLDVTTKAALSNTANATIGVRINKTVPVSTSGVWASFTFNSGGTITINLGTTFGATQIGAVTTGSFALPLTTYTCELRVNGDAFQVYINGILYLLGTSSAGNTQNGVGIASSVSSGNSVTTDNFQVYTGVNLASYRQTNIVAVSGGNIYQGDITTQATVVTGGTSQLNDTLLPQGAYTTGKYYFVDGFNIRKLDLVTKSMVTYTATAGTAPTLCTLAAVFRDRLVLAAPRDNPQNFFFSRVGTHTDWDYSQTDSAAAFAGNASVAGRIGEPIVALMPFSDDVMLIGGDHNLWAIRGDPADGGSIDMVSDAIGVLGPNAWTKSPDGTIYFVGTGGLYKMAPGSPTPQNISSDKWNDFFRSVDRGLNFVRMAWDRDGQGAYVFITPVNSGTATHLWYDARSDSFWPIQFPNTHGPISALVYDGDGPTDRALLLGGRSGFVQKLTQTGKSDDGTAISSFITIGPYKSSDVTEAILEWLDVILGEPQTGFVASDYNVSVQILAGQTVEEAALSPRYTRSKTFTLPRRQIRWLNRTRGTYFFLKLSNSTLNKTFNFEKALASFIPGGLVRRR